MCHCEFIQNQIPKFDFIPNSKGKFSSLIRGIEIKKKNLNPMMDFCLNSSFVISSQNSTFGRKMATFMFSFV